MKKRLLPLLMVLILFLTACTAGGTVQQADEAGIAALKTAGETVAKNLREGNYSAVSAEFDGTMKKALKDADLEKSWVDTVTSIGDYVKPISTEYSYEQGYNIVLVQEAYTNSALNVRVVYGQGNKISGLQTKLIPLPYEETTSEAYSEEKIKVAGNPEMPLDGLLTLPTNVTTPPVVILVQGSGQSDMNETVNANRPFADLAHGLAEKGIATLRYNKRYFQYPDKATATLGLEEEILEDVTAAIALMEQDARVDGKNVFVLGHSLGGMLTPVIAVKNPTVSGIISMAGSLRPLYELSYDQNQEVIKNIDKSTLTKEQSKQLDEQIAQVEKDIEALRGDIREVPDETLLMGLPTSYQRSVQKNAGLNFIESVSCPILVLQGGADFQVYPDIDYPLWQETLEGRDNATFHLYDQLNHLMMQTSGKRDISEYQTAGNVEQVVIDDIAAFVSSNK